MNLWKVTLGSPAHAPIIRLIHAASSADAVKAARLVYHHRYQRSPSTLRIESQR